MGIAGAILVIIVIIISLSLLMIGIMTFIRLFKVLGRVQNFFDEFTDNDLSLAQITYSNAVNLQQINEYYNDNDCDDLLNASERPDWEQTDSAKRDLHIFIKIIIGFTIAIITAIIIALASISSVISSTTDAESSMSSTNYTTNVTYGTYTGYINNSAFTITINEDGTCNYPDGEGLWGPIDNNHIEMTHPQYGIIEMEVIEDALIYNSGNQKVYFYLG